MAEMLDYVEGEVEMRPLQVHRWHNGCGGEFIAKGGGFTRADGTSWRHECDKCGGSTFFRGAYPMIVFKPAKEK